MKLLVKFNLIYVIVMALGVGVSGYLTRALLVQNAREEVLSNARQLIDNFDMLRNFLPGQLRLVCERGN